MTESAKRVGILGQNLRRVMEAKGVGVSELAARCGLRNRSTITTILDGSSPGSMATAQMLAGGLGVHISELVGAPPRLEIDMDALIARWKTSDEAALHGPLTAGEEAEIRMRGPYAWAKEPSLRAFSAYLVALREGLR